MGVGCVCGCVVLPKPSNKGESFILKKGQSSPDESQFAVEVLWLASALATSFFTSITTGIGSGGKKKVAPK